MTVSLTLIFWSMAMQNLCVTLPSSLALDTVYYYEFVLLLSFGAMGKGGISPFKMRIIFSTICYPACVR